MFAQLVDDPSSWPDRFPTEEAQDAERKRLHKVIERMVPWEASNDEAILNEARWEIARSVAWGLGEEPPPKGDGKAILDYLQTKAPPVYDPFSGGGSIPLEAQRLGLARLWLGPQSGRGADRQGAGGNPAEIRRACRRSIRRRRRN